MNEPRYSTLNQLENMLKVRIPELFLDRPTNISARSYISTDDVERTIGYIVNRWKDGMFIDGVKLEPKVHPEPYSLIYERRQGISTDPPITNVVEQYSDSLLIVKGDFRNIGKNGCSQLLTDLVEDARPYYLEVWKSKRVHLLFVCHETDYTFLTTEPRKSGEHQIGVIRLPDIFYVLWSHKSPQQLIDKVKNKK